jgi:rare lipoprotein A (peptidoglycan hydrolase)
MGATLTVTNMATGMSVSCVVVSRGPYGAGVVVDLAEATFAVLAPPSQGVAYVRVTW